MENLQPSEKLRQKILEEFAEKYPGKEIIELAPGGMHIACITQPPQDHPDYDVAIEAMIKTKPHYHKKMVQEYRIIKGELILHVGDKNVHMKEGDTYTVQPNIIHWAESVGNEICWDELTSTPAWTPEDHIVI